MGERLLEHDDVVVEPVADVSGDRRENDDSRSRLESADFVVDLEPVVERQHDVEQDEIVRSCVKLNESVLAIDRLHDSMTVPRKDDRDELQDVGIVLNDQDRVRLA